MKKIIVLSLAACIPNLLFSAAPDIKTITLRSLAGEEWFVETSEATTIGDVALESAARGFCKRPQTEIKDANGNVIGPATLGEYITITSRGEVLAGDVLVNAYVTTAEKDLSGTSLLFNALIDERSPKKGKELLQTLKNAASPDADPQQITATTLELIHAGATVNIRSFDDIRNSYDESPLHWAAKYGLTQIAKALIDAGADVNACNRLYPKESPLHSAAKWGHTAIAQALIDAGANVNARDKLGSTPLHSTKNVLIAQTLLAAGAYINAQDLSGRTPLCEAAVIRYTNTVACPLAAFLLAAGANPHIKVLSVDSAHMHWKAIIHILEENDEKSAEQKPRDEGGPA